MPYIFRLNQKAKTYSLIMCIFVSFLTLQFVSAQEIKVGVEATFLNKYKAWVKEAGGSCEKIILFRHPDYARRGTLDLIFLCQALKLGGWKGEILLIETPNYARALVMAKSGTIDMPGESAWDSDIDQNVFYQTEPIIKVGEFQVGFFTKPENLSRIKINTKEDLQNYSAVSSEHWIMDWKLWEKLKPKKLYSTYSTEGMFKMVNGGRADFVLMGFSVAPDKSNIVEGIKLVPVPGIKTTLSMTENRRFVVSMKSPRGKEIFKALDDGINILIKKGTINRAWRESGFINVDTDNWKMILP